MEGFRREELSGLLFDNINLLHLVLSLFLSVPSPPLHPGCPRRGRDGTGNFAKARQMLSADSTPAPLVDLHLNGHNTYWGAEG